MGDISSFDTDTSDTVLVVNRGRWDCAIIARCQIFLD